MYSDSYEVPVPVEVPVLVEDDQSRLTKRALDIVIKSGHFGLKDSLNLRKTSKSLKNSVDKTLYFHTTILYRILRKEPTDGLLKTQVAGSLPRCYRAIINEGKQGLKPYLREFFELMLDNLVGHPKIVCLLVQIAKKVSLKPSDFQELGQEVLTLFEFLTKPIQNKEKENEDKILNCIVELKKNGYTKKQCENLEASIRETFKFLRDDGNLGEGFIYKNLSGAHLTGANFEGANLCGANLKKANLIGASLPGANLSEANLTGANLAGADFRIKNGKYAKLNDANLSGANLEGVNFNFVDLSGANLSGANLSCANFNTFDLAGANLSRANLAGSNFCCPSFFMSGLIGANFSGANFDDAEIIINDDELNRDVHHSVVKYFINTIENSIKLNSAGILPLLFLITQKALNKIDSDSVVRLKKLSQECLKSLLEKISTVEELNKFFSQISVKDNVFCTEIYPDVLTLIAKAYIYRNLSCEPELDYLEIDFRKKLIEEVNKQKNPLSFHNDGWNSLLAEIEKAELKSSQSFNSQSHIKQM